MSTKKSFTLIEMLIVVVIIGILAAALIPRLQSVQARARDTKRKADLHQIGTAMAIYKEDNGNYNPLWQAYPNVQYMGTFFIADNNPNHQTNHNTTGINEVLERYMTSIPMDPTLSTSWRDANYDPIYGYVLGLLPRHYHSQMDSTMPFDAMVLGARTESDGSSSNWVSDGDYGGSDLLMTGDGTNRAGAIMGNDAGGANTPGFNAQSYDDYMCTTVTLGTGLDNNGSGTCTARKDSDDLRYIYVQ